MARLKVYEWEKERWPEFERVVIDKERRAVILRELAGRFNIPAPGIRQSYRPGTADGYGGRYSFRTATIRVGVRPRLSTLVHEFAHHLHCCQDGRPVRWHGKDFKRYLALCYAAGRTYLR